MTHYYFDTSAIVKLYLPEAGTRWVGDIFQKRGTNGNALHVIAFSKVAVVETSAAIARLSRMGVLSASRRNELYDLFLDDATHRFSSLAVDDAVVRHAAELTQRHPLRGYDAVHLASALALNRILTREQLAPAIFVSADDVLCAAAAAEGLQVENPNNQP